ncbi:MAG: universal stress protein [Deltaproteobacteria bacterium]|nr:MAG: universal stress protein [Deltaproteobacteria bacterium]
MVKGIQRKILVAVDGSEGALAAVRYVSKTPSFEDMKVVLFTVYGKIPEYYWDLGKEGSPAWRIPEVKAWEVGQKKTSQEYMEKARKILWRAGFSKERVELEIHERERGFARDILREAKREYSAVVVGRKGISQLRGLPLGSVSTKLLEKINFTTLVVVGRNPQPGAVLLALDGSENSLRTVDYVGAMLGGSHFEVGLIHVVRGGKEAYLMEAQERMAAVFVKAKSRLMRSGFESNQINNKMIMSVASRASAIVEEAKLGGYGTIVVGRRGLSKVQDFFMGRVSNKVVQLAKGEAVWVVS